MATSRICSIVGCGKPMKARGWCGLHHQRWRKYGNPVGGGHLKGEGVQYIKERAIPFVGDDCLWWPFGQNGKGYGVVLVDGVHWLAHRFVCTVVNGTPPSENHQAAHSCGNRTCCNPRHIRWATATENQQDRIRHGTSNRGRGKLTESDVRAIRALEGSSNAEIVARKFGISAKYVWEIQALKKWAWLA